MPALSDDDRAKAIQILEQARRLIDSAAVDDPDLRHQIRRYIIKRLEFDERGTPTQRRKLKDLKRKFQRGLCYACAQPLPEKGAELHRLQAIEGYTETNTRLLCRACHQLAEQAVSHPARRSAKPPNLR
jgi:RNase P subunit RPR2